MDEWDPRTWNPREKIAGVLWLAAFVTAAASYYSEWRLFGDYDRKVFFGLFLVGLILIARFPGVKRL